jgi:tetratricopeptide (TPR) repeat protein
MKLTISRVLSLIAIPCLLYLAYIAGSWSLADIYASPSINMLEKWRSEKITLNDDDWDKLRADLSYALEHDPENPDIHEYLALAIEGRFANTAPVNKEAMPSRREAYAHYKESISIRPSWPYAWVNLALVKYRLGETDDEFYHALHKADELGPWEPGVQRVIVDIGLHSWNSLSHDERNFVLNIIDKSLNHSIRKHSINVLDLTKRYGLLELVCLIHEDIDYVEQYCTRNLKKDPKSN